MKLDLDTLIAVLCFQCERRKTVCGEQNKPSFSDAYMCMHDKAEDFYNKIEGSFKEAHNDKP